MFDDLRYKIVGKASKKIISANNRKTISSIDSRKEVESIDNSDNNIIALPKKSFFKAKDEISLDPENLQKVAIREKQTLCANIFLEAMKLKDLYTYGHLLRVAHYSVLIGKEIDLNEDELYSLELTGLLHDVGKLGIPDNILKKPSHLNNEEFHIMKNHSTLSYETLIKFPLFEGIAKMARHHHERYDGNGYPDKLKEDQIPLFSRIVVVADTFDAMTSTRPYRKGMDREITCQELKEFSGLQFDPTIVEKFFVALKKDGKEEKFSLNIIEGKFIKDSA